MEKFDCATKFVAIWASVEPANDMNYYAQTLQLVTKSFVEYKQYQNCVISQNPKKTQYGSH